MKKFTLLLVTLLATMMATAQTIVPKGTVTYYQQTGTKLPRPFTTPTAVDGSHYVGIVIDGNDIYFGNLSSYRIGNWVKGTLGADGKTVTIPQDNIYDKEYYYDTRLAMFKLEPESEGSSDLTPVLDKDTPITFKYENGVFTLQNVSDGKHILGLCEVNCSEGFTEGTWFAGIDCEMILSIADQPLTVPSEAVAQTYMASYNDGYNDNYNVSSLYTLGNDVYLVGGNSLLPDAVIKGTINGNKIHFDNNQFVGIYNGKKLSNIAVSWSKEISEYGYEYISTTELDAGFDLIYDETSGKYVAPDGVGLRYTDGDPQEKLLNLVLAPLSDKVLTPAKPDLHVSEGPDMVFAYFYISYTSVEGEMINPDNLSFIFYKNGTPYPQTIYDEDGNEKQVTERSYNDWNYDFPCLDFEKDGLQKIGVQLVYRVGDEVRYSEIAEWTNTTTGITDVTNTLTAPRKVLVNGKMAIQMPDGKTFNAAGARIK